MEPIEYFESDKYSIIFKKGTIRDFFGDLQEIIAYIVIDKDERLEKYLNKTIFPLLKKILKKFISHFNGCNLTKSNQFESFKNILDKLFNVSTLTFEERVVSLLT